MVFQQHSLFPWKTVLANVEFGLKMRGIGARARTAQARAYLDLVGLSGFERAYPGELSGGMQQRVGIARVLVNRPRVMLMDEPFGALDAQTRLAMQELLLGVWREVRTTVLFVTHDIDEATLLGNRIAVLSKGGHLEQYDTPSQVLGRPATPFVADFVGADRGVRRLAVMPVEPDSLFHPPVVRADVTMLDARATAAGADSRWAVVVDHDGHLRGWVDLEPGLKGAVEDNLRPFEVEVPLGTSLRAAFGEMLQHDVRWLPVVHEGRYLGVITPNSLHAAVRRSVGGEAVEA